MRQAGRRLGTPFETAAVLAVRGVAVTLDERNAAAAVLLTGAAELVAASRNTWTGGYVVLALAAGTWLLGTSASHTAEYGIAVNFPTSRGSSARWRPPGRASATRRSTRRGAPAGGPRWTTGHQDSAVAAGVSGAVAVATSAGRGIPTLRPGDRDCGGRR